MPDFLANMSSDQRLAALAIAAGAVVTVVFILAILWYQLQALATQTALKREVMGRNLSPADTKLMLDSLMPPPVTNPYAMLAARAAVPAADLRGEVLRYLVAGASGELPTDEVEELTAAV